MAAVGSWGGEKGRADLDEVMHSHDNVTQLVSKINRKITRIIIG